VAETGDVASDAKEEEKVMTLDEWKAQEDGKRAKADFNIRKPGEGCNGDPQWNKMVALTKKEKTEGVEDEEELVRRFRCRVSSSVSARFSFHFVRVVRFQFPKVLLLRVLLCFWFKFCCTFDFFYRVYSLLI